MVLRSLERLAFVFALGPFFHYIRYNYLWWISLAAILFLVVRRYRNRRKTRYFVDGYVAPGFEGVAEVYRQNMRSRQDLGSAFAVYHKGALVVDLWGGYSDVTALRYRQHDTIGLFYSSTKAVTAVVMAVLADRGLIDYEAKISEYWPEFSQNGKEDIQVKTLLSHNSGLLAIREKHRLASLLDDPDGLADLLAKQKPFYKPGSAVGYHTLTFGLYADQLVKRVDKQGRGLGQFFQEEIAKPFDIEFYIGLPKELHYRCCREFRASFGMKFFFTTLIPVGIRFIFMVLYSYINFGTFYLKNLINNPTDWRFGRLNDPKFREIPSGASHGFGTARAVAKLMGILGNGGVHGSKTLLSPRLIDFLNTPLAGGLDRVVLRNITYGPGVVMDEVKDPQDKQSHHTFGHWGAGGQMAYTDPKHSLGWAYNTNFSNLVHGFVIDHRYTALHKAMYECIYKLNHTK